MAVAKTEAPRLRRLTVTFQDGVKQADFKFEGRWTGFEVSTVASNLRRAYLRMTRDQRRAVPSETSITPTTEETK